MSRYALIANGVVVTVVEQDSTPSLPDYTAVACDGTSAASGWTYDGNTFTAPDTDTWLITQLALKRRWPRSKWVALMGAASMDANIADFVQSFQLARFIDLKDAETVAGVQSLTDNAVDASIRLTAGEVAAILDVPAAESEKP